MTLASWASEALTAGLYQSARGREVRAGGREVLLLMVGLLSSPSAGFRGLALITLNLSARGREVLAGGREVRLRIVVSALFPIHHSTISKVFPATTPAWLTCFNVQSEPSSQPFTRLTSVSYACRLSHRHIAQLTYSSSYTHIHGKSQSATGHTVGSNVMCQVSPPFGILQSARYLCRGKLGWCGGSMRWLAVILIAESGSLPLLFVHFFPPADTSLPLQPFHSHCTHISHSAAAYQKLLRLLWRCFRLLWRCSVCSAAVRIAVLLLNCSAAARTAVLLLGLL